MIKSREELHEYIKLKVLTKFLEVLKDDSDTDDEYMKRASFLTMVLAYANVHLQDEIFGDTHNA